jgi:hypothetical protein
MKGMEKERDISCRPALMQEMEAKTQNGGPHLLVLYWRAGGITWSKDNGSGWLRQLVKTGRGHPPRSRPVTASSHPNQRQYVYFRTSHSLFYPSKC